MPSYHAVDVDHLKLKFNVYVDVSIEGRRALLLADVEEEDILPPFIGRAVRYGGTKGNPYLIRYEHWLTLHPTGDRLLCRAMNYVGESWTTLHVEMHGPTYDEQLTNARFRLRSCLEQVAKQRELTDLRERTRVLERDLLLRETNKWGDPAPIPGGYDVAWDQELAERR